MARHLVQTALTVATVATTMAFSTAALAQDDDEGGMKLPQQAAAAPGDSDHAQMIGRLGVGFLGRRSMVIATDQAGGRTLTEGNGLPPGSQVGAPVVGIRYWLDDMLGIDAGLGLAITGGATTAEAGGQSVETDKAGVTAFIIHGGVPLSLASAKHFSFQVVPELNVGFASSTVKGVAPPGGAAPPDLELTGFHLDVGARAGAEIHFGFIGIPELALQGSIGLRFDMDKSKGTLKSSPETSFEHSDTRIGTTVGSNPWGIFTNSVAALYYF